MFEIPYSLLQKMRCMFCGDIISFPPVYQQKVGENLCGVCYSEENKLSRNHLFEDIGSLFYYPCKFEGNGCHALLRWSESPEHKNKCKFGNITSCIANTDCKWKGSATELYVHFQKMHANLIATPLEKLPIEISKNMLLKVYNFLFVVHIDIPNHFHCNLQVTLLDVPKLAEHFEYHVEINNNDNIFKGNDIFVAKVNKMFDKHFTNNVVSFKRSYNSAIKIKRNKLKCINCGKVFIKLFKNNSEYCSNSNYISLDNSSSNLRRCFFSKSGCRYIDILENLNKHQVLFCEYFFGGKCSICNFYVKNAKKSMFQHEIEKHHVIKFKNTISILQSTAVYPQAKHVQLVTKHGIFICKWELISKRNFKSLVNTFLSQSLLVGEKFFVIHIISNLPHNLDNKIRFIAKFNELKYGLVEEKILQKKLCEDLNNFVEEWYAEFKCKQNAMSFEYSLDIIISDN